MINSFYGQKFSTWNKCLEFEYGVFILWVLKKYSKSKQSAKITRSLKVYLSKKVWKLVWKLVFY